MMAMDPAQPPGAPDEGNPYSELEALVGSLGLSMNEVVESIRLVALADGVDLSPAEHPAAQHPREATHRADVMIDPTRKETADAVGDKINGNVVPAHKNGKRK